MAIELVESKEPEGAELLKQEPRTEAEEPQQTTLNPLHIPDEIWKREEERLREWINDELTAAEGERGGMIEKFIRWNKAYDAPLSLVPKNFPIHNASNITAPLIKEHVHTLVGQLVQSTISLKPPVVLEDLAPEWETFVDPIQDFLAAAAERELNWEESGTDWVLEASILGTSILEVTHVVDERKIYRYTADGLQAYPVNVVFHDGPKFRHVPIGSFWIRMFERDPEEARWCAKELTYSLHELQEKQAQGKFANIDKILKYYEEQEDDVREAQNRSLDQTSAGVSRIPDRFKIFEFYCTYDIDRDGRNEELRLYYHRDSQTFLGYQFLPNWNGKRGFIKLGYFPRVDRFYDEGIAEMLEQIQTAVSAVINRRADNATMANLKMIIKRRMLKTLQPGDPLYTGKVIEANDIWNDIREFSLSEIYPSTVNEEMIFRQIADRLSGTSEAAAGAALPVSRTTAAAQLALLQEQRNRLGLTISAIRKAGQKAWLQAVELYSQFGTNGKAIAWMGERGRQVEAIFRLPRRVTELGMGMRISAPTSTQNSQVKRENLIASFNLTVQLYERLLPLAQGLAPDATAEIARALVSSARHFLRNILESFDEISDPAEILSGLVVLERLLPAPENLGGLESFNRAAQTAEINDRLSRMESLLREAEGTREGNTGVRAGDQRPSRITPPEGNGRQFPGGGLLSGEPLFRS